MLYRETPKIPYDETRRMYIYTAKVYTYKQRKYILTFHTGVAFSPGPGWGSRSSYNRNTAVVTPTDQKYNIICSGSRPSASNCSYLITYSDTYIFFCTVTLVIKPFGSKVY